MKSDELREAYLNFFESKGSTRRPSDVLVPKGDPTVLFTPAGMNQFKREFLGLGDPNFKRAVTCQKCLRTADIENVGKTAYHHTFFEMLGNFSFGDYFKRETILWAWEFCTARKWLNLPAEKLSVSVYQDDDEAAEIWQKGVGLPSSKIARMGEHDNFWPAGAPSEGPDGLCGPCSEIFYHPPVGEGVEIWNLVFTQFNRAGPPPENLKPLPSRNIDTGMGLERAAMVLQAVHSNFDIDIFRPIIEAICDILGRRYEPKAPEAVRIRRIADHARAVTFCLHENVFPSNEKQGYVVRRLLRRAVLDGFRLGLSEPFFHRLAPVVAEAMRQPYPELLQTAASVSQVVEKEERQFLSTLEVGVGYLEELFRKLDRSGSKVVSGEEAFKLHATYGFPVELTESLAVENKLGVDRTGYDRLWAEHVELSGSGLFSGNVFQTGIDAAIRAWHVQHQQGTAAAATSMPASNSTIRASETDSILKTRFLGYDTTEAQGTVTCIISQNAPVDRVRAGHEGMVALVLDQSPFYAEAGGQVGDTGEISGERFAFQVKDTQRDGDFILHLGELKSGTVKVGDQVRATVDAARRIGIRRAHSATHLLHYALRQQLGFHATQSGSKVDQDYLRFDFTHPEAVGGEQLERIEDLINARIREAVPVQWQHMPLSEAKRLGAMALFGEKYGDVVRVVTMGDFSRELCGGTHLDNTGQVGLCKITSEASVAAGTRRIVALTGPAAVQHVQRQEEILRELSQVLGAPVGELSWRANAVLEEIRTLKKRVSQRGEESAAVSVDELVDSATEVAGVKVVLCELPGATPEQMRRQIDLLRRKASPIAVLLATPSDGKVQMIAALSRELVERGLDAVDWVREAAKIVGGGGGGRPDLAQAGGKYPEKLAEALAQGMRIITEQLKAAGQLRSSDKP